MASLRHLVGRKLVPFFIEDEKGGVVENTTRDIGMSASLDFSKDTNAIPVRKWNTESGLFEDPLRLDANANPQNHQRKSIRRRGKSGSPTPKGKAPRNPSGTPPKAKESPLMGGSGGYGMPEFLVPPDPKDIPLPSFVLSKLKPQNRPPIPQPPKWGTPNMQSNRGKANESSRKVPRIVSEPILPISRNPSRDVDSEGKGSSSRSSARKTNGVRCRVKAGSGSNPEAAKIIDKKGATDDGEEAVESFAGVHVQGDVHHPTPTPTPPPTPTHGDLLDMICLTEGGLSEHFQP
ncbi:hypothetical protein AAMO2058_000476000 [Amorphochlora amoebiformis]